MSAYVGGYRDRFGVEPICRTPSVSASGYRERASGERSKRGVEDERLTAEIRELHGANYGPMGSGGCGRRSGGSASTSAATGSLG